MPRLTFISCFLLKQSKECEMKSQAPYGKKWEMHECRNYVRIYYASILRSQYMHNMAVITERNTAVQLS